jgi:hypothetical protein
MPLVLGQSKNAGYVIIIGGLLFLGEVTDDVAARGVALGLESREIEKRPSRKKILTIT